MTQRTQVRIARRDVRRIGDRQVEALPRDGTPPVALGAIRTRRPSRCALRDATARAASLASVPVTTAAGHAAAIASANAPLPVPRSTTRGLRRRGEHRAHDVRWPNRPASRYQTLGTRHRGIHFQRQAVKLARPREVGQRHVVEPASAVGLESRPRAHRRSDRRHGQAATRVSGPGGGPAAPWHRVAQRRECARNASALSTVMSRSRALRAVAVPAPRTAPEAPHPDRHRGWQPGGTASARSGGR